MKLLAEQSQFIEFEGRVYTFDKPYPYDQLWFIVKNMSKKNMPSDLTISASFIWKCEKELHCNYDTIIKNQLTNFIHDTKIGSAILQGSPLG